MNLVVVWFLIATASGVIVEQGHGYFRSCAHAVAWLTEGLRDGQQLHIEACEPLETREARR